MNHELEKEIVKGLVADYSIKCGSLNNLSNEELAQVLCEISERLTKKIMRVRILKKLGKYNVGDVLPVNAIDGTVDAGVAPMHGIEGLEYGYRADRLITEGFAIEVK